MNIKNSILLLSNHFVTLGGAFNFFDRSESALHNNQRCLMCFVEVQARASLEVFVTIANLFENPNLKSKKMWKTNIAKTLKVSYLDFKLNGQHSSKFSIHNDRV